MTVNFGEAAVFGTVGVVVAEVPLAEHAGGIAIILEKLPEGDFIFAQHGAAVHGVPDAGAIGPVTGEESAASG